MRNPSNDELSIATILLIGLLSVQGTVFSYEDSNQFSYWQLSLLPSLSF